MKEIILNIIFNNLTIPRGPFGGTNGGGAYTGSTYIAGPKLLAGG